MHEPSAAAIICSRAFADSGGPSAVQSPATMKYIVPTLAAGDAADDADRAGKIRAVNLIEPSQDLAPVHAAA